MAIFTTIRKRGSDSSSNAGDSPIMRSETSQEKIVDASQSGTKDEASTATIIRRPTHISDEEGQVVDIHGHDANDAFGSEEGAAIQYKTMHWWHTAARTYSSYRIDSSSSTTSRHLLIAENISLGVLALPSAVAALGLVPGLLLIFFLGVIAGYTGYILGQFKQAFPQVTCYADMGGVVAGKTGQIIFATGSCLILIFIMAAHILSFSIAMNVITDHSQCTLLYMVVGLLLSFILGLPRTMKGVSFLSVSSCVSVVIAVTVVIIAVAITKPDVGNIMAVGKSRPVVEGLNPVMYIILAFTGHAGFPSFIAEMKNPRDFPKALLFMQIMAVSFYMLIAAVIYYYAGPYVASPALGSAGPIVRKVAYGLAMPTIVIAGVANGSVVTKYVYIRVWRGTNVIHETSFKSIGSWIGICAATWTTSWLIAEAIPNFNILLGLIGSLLGSWISYGIPAALWLYMNKGRMFSTRSKICLTILNVGIVILGALICILGMWSSGWELAHGRAGRVFSCDNNWNPSH
ncbi:transmembrane amino acid transporter protein-domain-containing protein [Lophiotrema nucula]|uniref:Transmembrane amino acid transporter protein-domain-containing protein n=1 Tax=Lophiotrema nucula TaxID=690887 RepID=A0A6A5ZH78_9PLEO|nr:transmembrane amino acid transporter protein-domain-containing protein [Lophiotrema nucula]